MLAYVVRRVLYAIPILIGVNLHVRAVLRGQHARRHGAHAPRAKRVTPEAIEKWKQERGYDKDLLND